MVCVRFLRDVEDVVPYRKILLFSVGEAFRLPFFVHGMRLFSGGGNQTSLRSVANLLRKNCPSPTACFLHTKNELFFENRPGDRSLQKVMFSLLGAGVLDGPFSDFMSIKKRAANAAR